MTNEETVSCWACDKSIPKSSLVCPFCDMPMTDSSDEVDDIDSLLDDLSSKSSDIDDSLPDIPTFGEETQVTESSDEDMPAIPEFNLESTEEILETDQERPTIPSFDDEMPTIPDFDSELDDNDQTIDVVSSEVISDEISEPKIPDFEDDTTSLDDIEETIELLKGESINLSNLSTKQKLRIFIPQLTYWSLVFIIISMAGVKVDNSNFDFDTLNQDYYSIKAELFLFGWISFLPMGWFYRYKLNQFNVKESLSYGFLYLIVQFLFLSIVSLILFLFINPDAQLASLSDTDTSVTAIMTTYVYFSWLGFVITGLTLGFLLFFVGYRFYFDQIYKTTPLSEITN
ncbi:MAG: hypothetical protein GPJ54_17245 [Candidatus Heimdallarchaeota archaeon]|nr:hypothetical protein [Candidatus Heimdallarchaeota archaeon]